MQPIQVYEGNGPLPDPSPERVEARIYTGTGASYTEAEISSTEFDLLQDIMRTEAQETRTVILHTPHADYLAHGVLMFGLQSGEDNEPIAQLHVAGYEEMLDAPASPSI